MTVEAVLREAIADGAFPGACYAVLAPGREPVVGALGTLTYGEGAEPTTRETVWDLASVTKVVGTTSAAMRLVEAGRLDLDGPVAAVIPEFGQNGKGAITFRNLMVHNSGLVAFRRYHEFCTGRAEVLAAIYGEGLEYPTGSKTVYSDLSMILVGEAIERITGRPLNEFLREEVFLPLGMRDTDFLPSDPAKCAPTETWEAWRGESDSPYLQGQVHDPTAAAMGGVAGHAGLFSTVDDLCTFMTALVDGRVASRETVAEFTRRQSAESTRALGWDTKSPEGSSAGARFGARSFGHTGYTGTSVWHDPDAGVTAILLTNRVHLTSENLKIMQVRPRFYDAAFGLAFDGDDQR